MDPCIIECLQAQQINLVHHRFTLKKHKLTDHEIKAISFYNDLINSVDIQLMEKNHINFLKSILNIYLVYCGVRPGCLIEVEGVQAIEEYLPVYNKFKELSENYHLHTKIEIKPNGSYYYYYSLNPIDDEISNWSHEQFRQFLGYDTNLIFNGKAAEHGFVGIVIELIDGLWIYLYTFSSDESQIKKRKLGERLLKMKHYLEILNNQKIFKLRFVTFLRNLQELINYTEHFSLPGSKVSVQKEIYYDNLISFFDF